MQKSHLYLHIYGMICISFIILIIHRFIERNLIDTLSDINQDIVKIAFLLLAAIFWNICALNIFRFREIPRPRLPSITGISAIITGIIITIPIMFIEIDLIIRLVNLLK